MNKQLMIIGFHRSGTSMLTQELSNAGLFVGDRLLGPHISNVDGHYEDFDFFSLHEKILHSQNKTWQYTSKILPFIDEKFDQEIEILINDRDQNHKEWGFKDPRTSLFLSSWQEKLSNPYTVVIYRHYEECVNSLLHRNAIHIANNQTSDISFWKDSTLAYKMWLSYNQKIIKHVEKNPQSSIVFSHSAIVEGFPFVQTINEKFGFNLDISTKSAIKKELLTSRSFNSYSLDSKLEKELNETWKKLQSLSLVPSDKLPSSVEDTPSNGINDLRKVLTSLNISIEDKNVIQEVINELTSTNIDIKEKIKVINQNRHIFHQFQSNNILIEVIIRLIESHPKVPEFYFIVSELYTQSKEFKESEFYLMKTFTIADKVFPYFYNKLSDFYIKTNQLALAQIAIENAIKGNPNNPAFYFTYARLEEKKSKYIQALEYIDKAIDMLNNQMNTEIVFTLYKINLLSLSIKGKNTAKLVLNELLKKYPDDKRIYEREKELFQKNKKENFDRKKEEEKVFINLREDRNYFSKLLSLLSTLDDGWASDNLLNRIVLHLKSKLDTESLMVKDNEKKQLIKTIYILWLQGFDNAPTLVKKCLESWIQINPTWNIVLLDESSLKEYINIDTYLNSKTISKASLSDIIRISLLNKYGGLWVDATTYCSRPLDDWLEKYTDNGFFAFNFEKHLDIVPDRPIASWFLYGEKDNYIINQWYKKTIEYCQKTVVIGLSPPSSTKEKWIREETEEHYFWFHYLFDDLYKSNLVFKKLWENIPKLSEKGPHFIQNNNMLKTLSENVRMHIDLKKSPLYKLSHRYDKKKYDEHCNLYYLLNPKYITMSIATTNYSVKDPLPYLHFIHIGKCAGTALLIAFKEQKIKLRDVHLKKPKVYNSDEKYIIWIRNPLHRFVSAFNYSLAIIKLDTSRLDSNNLTLDNCLAPGRIQYKMKNNHTFSNEYDGLMDFFQTANNLAESLSNKDITIKNKALKLMHFPVEHINRGIGWYLDNGNFVKEHNEQILFVGKVETMKNDISNLSKVLDISLNFSSEKIRENILYNKDLSKLAVANLLDFYKNTDYKALEELHKAGWIDKSTYQSYYQY